MGVFYDTQPKSRFQYNTPTYRVEVGGLISDWVTETDATSECCFHSGEENPYQVPGDELVLECLVVDLLYDRTDNCLD